MAEISPTEIQRVKIMAYWLARRTGTMSNREDYEQAGFVGLLQAKERFDPSMGIKFSTFSFYRIKGSMLDFMRNSDLFQMSWLQQNDDKPELVSINLQIEKLQNYDNDYHAETVIYRYEVEQRIREAIHELPEIQRKILDLYYWQDLPISRIAKQLSKQPPRVHRLLNTSHITLHNRLSTCM